MDLIKISTLNKNNKGFGAVGLILSIVIVILLGVIGWSVYKNNHSKNIIPTVSTTAQSQKSTSSKPSVSIYSSWQSYTLKYEKLTFKYPANWTVSDTSSSGIDNVTLTASDGFNFNIEDGVKPGGDPINLVSKNPIPVSFIGQSDYIVFTNPPTPAASVAPQPNIVVGASLLTNPNNYLSYPLDKNVLNVYNANYGQTGSNLSISMSYTTSPNNRLTLAQAESDKEFINSKLVIQSMAY